MSSFKQALLGVGVAVLLTVIVFGSLALSMVESGIPLAVLPTQVLDIGSPLRPTIEFQREAGIPTLDLQAIPDSRNISIPELVNSPFVSSCPPPVGWSFYTVLPDDTPGSLAERFGLSAEEFAHYNCMDLEVSSLVPGSTVNLPVTQVDLVREPTAVQADMTVAKERKKQPAKAQAGNCGPPSWWAVYIVRGGDTLFSLGFKTNTTVYEIQKANCLGSSTTIRTGQVLYLPFSPVAAVNPPKVRKPTPTAAKPTPYPTSPAGNLTPKPSSTTEVPPTEVSPTTVPPTLPPTSQPTTPPPTDPPVVTTEPPLVTTEPPVITTAPPVVTTEPPPPPPTEPPPPATTEPPPPAVTTESAPPPLPVTDTPAPSELFTDNLLRSWYDLVLIYPNWTFWLN